VGAKHYQKLGKTKIAKVPEGAIAFSQELWRILDTKDNPESVMETLIAIAVGAKVIVLCSLNSRFTQK
jgi:hypothetical protein